MDIRPITCLAGYLLLLALPTLLNAQVADNNFQPIFAAPGAVSSVVAQADDKLLVTGSFSIYSDAPVRRFVRLEANGDLDGSFTYDARIASAPSEITQLANGNILIAGNFRSPTGDYLGSLLRLLPDGSLDDTFSPVRGDSLNFYRVVELSNGKLFTAYVRCASDQHVNCNRYGVRLLLPDGAPDPNFPGLEFEGDGDPGLTEDINALVAQSPNDLLVFGTGLNLGDRQQTAFRLDSNGVVDGTFDPQIPSSSDYVTEDLAVGEDGTIAVLVSFQGDVVLLDRDGNVRACWDFSFYLPRERPCAHRPE
ncbi:delta-60 repeat domain-containing protein [Neolewinella antarctica]|uniref:Delta-60 repeat domain-containing protein n=1 Tax=Neolewinella antarctica TaxID=442734 RepID=A0ABX0XH16_9BACT|nr:delta-60 repeat domain-containing protein [Neolewinella antarctica]NJC28037.1 hypothetical protein [Neolewinella antarctica]